MPFRDAISFLVLPPGATPPVVGQPIIVLDPGPPPQLVFYTGDADEAAPAFVATEVAVDGSLQLQLLSPEHTLGPSSFITLSSGSDATPGDTEIVLGADLVSVEEELQVEGNPVITRVGTTTETTNSAAINTTETTILSITVALVVGRTYKITADYGYAVSDVTFIGIARIRETNTAGTELQGQRINAPTTASPWPYHQEGQFTASATGNKTFVATLIRTAGAGNINRAASATSPARIYVEAIG